MEIRYDVLREPWIPVTDQNGDKEFLGILDVLARAHELKEITDASPLVEYGLYRLLCVFLMDALRPGDTEDIEELLEDGEFDMDRIEAYVERCRESGASFDLFDEKRPFLQSPYVPEWDKEKKSIGYLDQAIPAGSNHTHFEHLNSDTMLSYGEAARLLPTCYLFPLQIGSGYHLSINGEAPFFTLVKGENLFQTLVYTLVPTENIDDFDSVPSFWNNKDIVERGKGLNKVSWLYGMLFPVRRVKLIPEKNGIRYIYFSPGVYLKNMDNWMDPHVTYIVNEKGRFAICPKKQVPIWENLNYLISVKGKCAPENIRTFSDMCDGSVLIAHIDLYGVYTKKKRQYSDLFCYDLELSTSMMNEETAEIIGLCIKDAETLGRKLGKALDFDAKKDKPSHGVALRMSEAAVNDFYFGCERYLMNMCHEDWSFKKKEPDAVLREWKLTLYKLGREVVEAAFSRVDLTGKQWVEVYEKQVELEDYLNKLKRKGENKGGKKQ